MCILPNTLYSFSLQFFNKASLSHPLKELRKMQQRAVIQITSAFYTSLTQGVEAIAGLISIHLHLQKNSSRHQIRTSSLPSNHVTNTLLQNRHAKNSSLHHLFLENMTTKQQLKIKSSIVDANNHLNEIFPSFDSLNHEFFPGFRLIDNFPSYFSFHQANYKDKR